MVPEEPESEFLHADITHISSICATTEEFLDRLNLTQHQINDLEQKTIGQSDNPSWFRMRKGRITASKFYNVHTRMETVKRNSSSLTDCSRLVHNLLNPTALDHLPHVQRGRKLEQAGVDEFIMAFESCGHRNIKVSSCGLFIDPVRQYLGASPDGIVTSDCCEKSLLEVKCPTTPFNQLPYMNNLELKRNSLYYGQIQGQMEITKVKSSHLVLHYPDETTFLEIEYDESFCNAMFTNLERFYKQFMIPALINPCLHPPAKKLKSKT